MSAFLTDVDLRIVPNGWITLNEIRYYSDHLEREVVIPPLFFTDLATVPWPLKGIIVPTTNAKNRPAAVVHDFLCDEAIQALLGINQKDADLVFLEALEVQKVHTFGRRAMYRGVRLFQSTIGRWFG